MATPDHRAADSDREATADRLREAAGHGRLEPDELEERLEAAYSARTYGELAKLTEDIPDRAPDPPGREPVWRSDEVRARLATFVIANVVCISVWVATGSEGDFWPKWVLLGTGIALFVTLVHRVLGVEEERDDAPAAPLPPGPPGLPRLRGTHPRGRRRR
jgi:hypothetical protein